MNEIFLEGSGVDTRYFYTPSEREKHRESEREREREKERERDTAISTFSLSSVYAKERRELQACHW